MITKFIVGMCEAIQLSMHDGLTLAASATKMQPEIQRAHLQGRAEIKDARLHLADAKTTKKVKVSSQKHAHAEERESLARKQVAEKHLLLDEQDRLIDEARSMVKDTKQAASQRLENVRRRLELARLEGLIGGNALTVRS